MSIVEFCSWNVRELRRQNSNDSFEIATFAGRPNILFLQEAPENLSYKDLQHDYKAEWMLEPSQFSADRMMGLVISSSYPIRNSRRLLLENPNWIHVEKGVEYKSNEKGVLYAEIELPDRVLKVGCIHLLPPHIFGMKDSSSKARNYLRKSCDQIITNLKEIQILAGDFNTQYRMDCFAEFGFISTTKDTCTRDSGESHDDVLISNELSVLEVFVNDTPSDHHIIKANLRF